MEERIALLIDAENVSAKYIHLIMDELSKYGNITYKRIYGDWTNERNGSWKEMLLQSSLTPIQQFSYVYGKNTTDSAMIIDAMDMLYTSELEGFCIVSSDSDFTKLASRLRESGKRVIGMGEEKTPMPFRKACDIFTILEALLEDDASMNEDDESGKKHDRVPKAQIEGDVVKMIMENQNKDKMTGLSEIGNRLVKLYPDFDVRRYGYRLLSKFLETMPKINISQKKSQMFVSIYEDKKREKKLQELLTEVIKDSGSDGISLGALGQKIHDNYENFKVQDYGFASFNKFIQSLPDIQVRNRNTHMIAYYKSEDEKNG